jgi:hypothetical protein
MASFIITLAAKSAIARHVHLAICAMQHEGSDNPHDHPPTGAARDLVNHIYALL